MICACENRAPLTKASGVASGPPPGVLPGRPLRKPGLVISLLSCGRLYPRERSGMQTAEKKAGLSRSELRPADAGQATQWRGRLGRGDTGLHHTATTRRCLLDSRSGQDLELPQWSVGGEANQTIREHFASAGSCRHRRSSPLATRLAAIGSGQARNHARTPPDFNTCPTVFSTPYTTCAEAVSRSAEARCGQHTIPLCRRPRGRHHL